jgi:hypothetical protein
VLASRKPSEAPAAMAMLSYGGSPRVGCVSLRRNADRPSQAWGSPLADLGSEPRFLPYVAPAMTLRHLPHSAGHPGNVSPHGGQSAGAPLSSWRVSTLHRKRPVSEAGMRLVEAGQRGAGPTSTDPTERAER